VSLSVDSYQQKTTHAKYKMNSVPHESGLFDVLNFILSDGDEGIRTPDLLRAKQALSQLSYVPMPLCVGQTRLELVTSRLSAECSNQLSY
jgi:hypothetical protein